MKRAIYASQNEVFTKCISQDEENYILKLFRKFDIEILETYNDTSYDDGTTFNEFVVVTDNTNQLRLGNLMRSLNELEDTHDIGNYDESNEHGFYAKDYHFYHYE